MNDEILQQYGKEIVSVDYGMDPETEEILYSDDLVPGMVVLLTFQHRRILGAEYQDLLIKSRWCVVTKPRVIDSDVSFVAVYADGLKVVRNNGIAIGWLVKKASIPEDFINPQQYEKTPETTPLERWADRGENWNINAYPTSPITEH